jgi:hypothetical protein
LKNLKCEEKADPKIKDIIGPFIGKKSVEKIIEKVRNKYKIKKCNSQNN